jgi:PAS domain S-box-containing protein
MATASDDGAREAARDGGDGGDWEGTAQALRRAALLVAKLGGPEELFDGLVRQLTADLGAAAAFIAVFADPQRTRMRTLAARLDGRALRDFTYELAGSPCAKVVGRAFHYLAEGVGRQFQGGTIFSAKGMDSYAAYPLNASDGTPLGLITAMDRHRIRDPELAESLMKIFAVRAAAELERQRALEALRDSEASYRAIFEAVEDAIFVHDWETGAVLDVNRKACEAYGYTREEMLGWSVDRFGSGESPYTGDEAMAWVQRAKAGERPRFIWHRRRSDGVLRWDEVRLRAVTINGEPHVLACTRDITERKEAVDALRSREAQYRAIFDGSADSLVLWNRLIRIVDVNAAFTRMYGYEPHEVIGGSFGNRLSDEEVARRSVLIERALAGEQGHLETTTVRKDGSRLDVELRYLPITHQGEPHVLVVSRDISARREAEARREELENQVRQAQKMEAIGQLTGGIAHDFNNILTTVIGYLAMAEERAGLGSDHDLVRQLDQAHLAASRARDLVSQMLTFARHQGGERQVVELAPLVRQSVQLLRATMPSSTIIDADVHSSSLAAAVDGVQIEQVLFNLCINARDAVHAHGRIRVGLRARTAPGLRCASCRADVPAGRWVELSVSDDGSGIAPEVLERMFDPFYSTKEIERGSGMGLAMVHGIVHSHRGHIEVQTRPGGGTTFRVMLPLAGEAQAREPQAVRPARHAVARAGSLGGRILLVEDQAMVGEFMSELLGNWGLEVTRYEDPLDALDWLRVADNALDLLITDQTMPRMTGLELASRAAALRPGLAVLLYTGDAAEFGAEALRRSGVLELMRKPIDPGTLHATLARLLGREASANGRYAAAASSASETSSSQKAR